MCKRQNLKSHNIKFLISKMKTWSRLGFLVNYFARIIEGLRVGISVKLDNNSKTIVYSASEFWMDSIPALLVKLRFSKIKWLAAWYQTAPSPFSFGWSLPYWLAQQPIKPLISHFADFVLVNNEEERREFPGLNKKNKVIVVLGGVGLKEIKKWKKKKRDLSKRYDAVFQGRFHPQKGVTELIDIWKKVVDKKPDAKLAMIGDGPLMENVKSKIKNLKLEDNIKLFGYVFDGDTKYRIFSQSKIVVHPAFYDSGGMASAEAMAFGVPAVGFDLESFKSYYPKGMIKVKTGDLDSFVVQVVRFLDNKKLRNKIGKEAMQMVQSSWSWDKRANKVLSYVKKD